MKHKAFKIENNETVNKTFRMPVELLGKLEQVATKGNISLNKLVIQCCKYALQNLKD